MIQYIERGDLYMRRKKKIGKIILIIILIILILCTIIGYFVYRDLKEENVLKEEINKIEELDLSQDEIDMEIKTSGDYKKVEKIIKNYLNDYSTKTKEILESFNQISFDNILSIENIKKDGPKFTESLKIINKINDIDKEIKSLEEMQSEEKIMKQIESRGLNNYYITLYKDIMLDEIKDELTTTKEGLETVSTSIKNKANLYLEAINFLKTNEGKWQVTNNNLYFNTKELTSQYNKITEKIKNS
jgi:hypothetical protein